MSKNSKVYREAAEKIDKAKLYTPLEAAKLAKETPDILVYLKAHAECILQVLRPQGLSYEMLAGKSFQRSGRIRRSSTLASGERRSAAAR